MRNLKNKKNRIFRGSVSAQETFGMSFSMIFSIILIIFFLAAAFMAIKYFLDYQKKVQIGLFFTDFQDKINEVWSSLGFVESESVFESTLPKSINYACFVDFSASSGSGLNSQLFDELRIEGAGRNNANFVLYPYSETFGMGSKNINHINIAKLTSANNPYCIKVTAGKIKIEISSLENII